MEKCGSVEGVIWWGGGSLGGVRLGGVCAAGIFGGKNAKEGPNCWHAGRSLSASRLLV